jgi:alkanesulfonate monooxygenase SsuD/methylene tetrahydromethanopterin reductase-like flavin-dependent oxidoreductase (luciferase family)
MYIADSQEEAIRRVEPYHDERYKWFAPFGFVRYADEQGRAWGTPGAPTAVPTIRDGVAQKAWLCGTPPEIVEGLRAYQEAYPGLDQVLIHWAEGMPPAEFKEQLRTFAREVMPAFPGASIAAATATS